MRSVALALAALSACSADGGWKPQSLQAPAQDLAAPTASGPSNALDAGLPTSGMSADMAAQLKQAMAASYLKGQWPNSLAILPPPPARGSAAQARDDAAAKAAQAMQGSPRWKQATQDADLSFPGVVETFACAVGVEISKAATPHTYTLMQRSMADVALSTYPTKDKYKRVRPFVATSTPTCTPDQEAFLRNDGSYPSGHTAIGWGWALILAEAAPDRQDAILSRGRAFGQSRVVCNAHWLSDTDEGRIIASATVAALHDAPEFRADLEAARAEIGAARSAGGKPARGCAVEAARLAQ
jgi:acid phosphatase (class A)